MQTIKFRTSFATRRRIGNRSKRINQRTISSIIIEESPILLIDLSYIEEILINKSRYSSSVFSSHKYEKVENYFLTIIAKASNLILPKGLLTVGILSESIFSEHLKKIVEKFSIPFLPIKIDQFLFSVKSKHLLDNPLSILTNNLSCWAYSNDYSKLSFLSVDTNNRLTLYNDKTGLDFFSNLIQTNKIINKLGLHNLKYLNLQYLYIILLYLSFTNTSSTSFFFDATYFKKLTKYTNMPFSKSKGLGYILTSEAHQFLSYPFLTKPEFLDYFLLSDKTEYISHFNRLVKLLNNDIKILTLFKQYYDTNFKLATPVTIPVISYLLEKPIKVKPLYLLSSFYSKEQPTNLTASEKRQLAIITNKYKKKYNINNDLPKISDNILEYVSNLLKDF